VDRGYVKLQMNICDDILISKRKPNKIQYNSTNWLNYIMPYGVSGASTGTTNGTNLRIQFVRILLEPGQTIKGIQVNVTTLLVGGIIGLGLYNSDADGYPSTLIYDFGSVPTDTIGSKIITSDFICNNTRKWVWAAVWMPMTSGLGIRVMSNPQKLVPYIDLLYTYSMLKLVQTTAYTSFPSSYNNTQVYQVENDFNATVTAVALLT
jgi:hypothetical protein